MHDRHGIFIPGGITCPFACVVVESALRVDVVEEGVAVVCDGVVVRGGACLLSDTALRTVPCTMSMPSPCNCSALATLATVPAG